MTKFQKQKRQMAYLGFYTESDYGEINRMSRQYVYKLVETKKLETRLMFERKWVKLDEGQNALKLYGENPLDKLLDFGFKKHYRSLVVSDEVVCDVKLLDVSGRANIRFYNPEGDCIILEVDVAAAEIIKHVPDAV